MNRLRFSGLAVLCLYASASLAAPSNDQLVDAISVDSLPFSQQQSVTAATDEASEQGASCVGDRYYGSVWYRYTAPAAQVFVVDTLGSDYDTVLSIWTGSTHPLTEISCNDDVGTVLQSQSFIETVADTTYWIKISSLEASGGTLRLNAHTVNPLGNDDLTAAMLITPDDRLMFNAEQLTVGASMENAEVTPSCAVSGEVNSSVWYRYTPSAAQSVSFNTAGSDYDTVLALWTGSAHPLTEIACNDDNGGNPTSQLGAELSAGTTYWLQVSGGQAATGILVFSMLPTPSNISAVEATVSPTRLPVVHNQFTHGALSNAAPPSCGFEVGREVWFVYTAENTGSVQIDTLGSDYNTVLSVWTGEPDALTEQACNDDAPLLGDFRVISQLTMDMTAGTSYYINVSGYEGETGALALSLSAAQRDFSIVQQPSDQQIQAGETATLSVAVAALSEAQGLTNPVAYQWYMGEVGDTSTPVGSDEVTYTSSALTQSTRFWVQVRNPTGSENSVSALVQVGDTSEIPNTVTNGAGITPEFTALSTQSHFQASLVSLPDEQATSMVSEQDTVRFEYSIQVDPEHVGQAATVVIVGQYQGTDLGGLFAFDQTQWLLWDGTFEGLGQLQSVVQLPSVLTVPLFEGQLLGLTGDFTFFLGYRLADGSLFYSTEPFSFSVN